MQTKTTAEGAITIRLAVVSDIPEIVRMYDHARKIMSESGNPNQWPPYYPAAEDAGDDIENGNCYLCEENGTAVGTFAFIIGEDPTYAHIDDGQWSSDTAYGTIHRIASNGKARGVANACLSFCGEQMAHLRADTHADNKIFQKLLERFGFRHCGTIYVRDECPRMAYEYIGS